MTRVFYLEDNKELAIAVQRTLSKSPFKVELFHNFASLDHATKNSLPDLLLLDIDLGLKERSGIEVAKLFHRKYPELIIIVYSSSDDNETMIEGFRAGIDNYVNKATRPALLAEALMTSYETAKVTRGQFSADQVNEKLRALHKHNLPPLIGRTMLGVASKLMSISTSSVETVHVFGESGAGKDVVASFLEAIRPNGTPFVKVNCAEIPPTLFESTLFGHKRGAFTGAAENRVGIIEAADGGWLFLDEIATIPLQAQASLLRAIGNKEIRAVGESRTKKINFRLISATNENLDLAVRQGRFREDLWNRIRDPLIELPPLRERGSDEITELLEYFCKSTPGGPYNLTPGLARILKFHEWRDGNAREMEKLIRSMTPYASTNKTLTEQHLPRTFWNRLEPNKVPTQALDDPFKVILDLSDNLDFETLTQSLFNETVKRLGAQYGRKMKKGELAKILHLAPNTITKRMRGYHE